MTGNSASAPFQTAPGHLEECRERIHTFLQERVVENGHDGLVVWLNDALEPAVIAMLAAEAIGPDRIRAVRPVAENDSGTVGGKLLANGLDIPCHEVRIKPVVARFEDAVAPAIEPEHGAPAARNLRDRLRMTALYHAADTSGRLVVGTLNRTRWLLGATTKHGVTAGDLLPLGHRYETEVRALADHLDIPHELFDTVPVPVSGFSLEDGEPPEVIDRILYKLIEEDKGLTRTATETGADPDLVRECAKRHATTVHKRVPPPTPADDDGHEFFHEIELQF